MLAVDIMHIAQKNAAQVMLESDFNITLAEKFLPLAVLPVTLFTIPTFSSCEIK
jgi:hypothetical protein